MMLRLIVWIACCVHLTGFSQSFIQEDFWVKDRLFWAKREGYLRNQPEAWDQAEAFWKNAEIVLQSNSINAETISYFIFHGSSKPHFAASGGLGVREVRLAVPIHRAIGAGQITRGEVYAILHVFENYSSDRAVCYFTRMLKNILISLEDEKLTEDDPLIGLRSLEYALETLIDGRSEGGGAEDDMGGVAGGEESPTLPL